MDVLKYVIHEGANPEIESIILKGLQDFNLLFYAKKYHAKTEYKPLVIYVKDDQSKVIAGLCGYSFVASFGSWITIEYAWVNESMRRQGVGRKIFQKVIDFGREKNFDYIRLYTWDFQAVGFYEKIGFECQGRIPKWEGDYDVVFFKKNLK